jgi:hypothetical protein
LVNDLVILLTIVRMTKDCTRILPSLARRNSAAFAMAQLPYPLTTAPKPVMLRRSKHRIRHKPFCGAGSASFR